MASQSDKLESEGAAFRLLAEEALQKADKAETQSVREACLKTATEWLRLAGDVRNLNSN